MKTKRNNRTTTPGRTTPSVLLCASLLALAGAGTGQSQCINLTCPESLTVCPDGDGADVVYEVLATSNCGDEVTLVCEPPSGSRFPGGTTLVECLATTDAGERAVCRFPVFVGDNEPPSLVVPVRTIVPCVGPDGAPVWFSVAAVDNCDEEVLVECEPASGSVFPIGTTTVHCVATDASGNLARAEFTVIVAGGCGGQRCVDLTVPEDMVVPCTEPGGARVTYEAKALNTCTGGTLLVVCEPPPDSLLPVGINQIICTVGEGAAIVQASFLIEVTDEVPPTLDCPSDLIVPAESPLGAVVFFEVSGKDDCSDEVRVRCSPPSGSVFPVGRTRVLCEGTDGNGNLAQCVFDVEVLEPEPFSAHRIGERQVELRWIGEAHVETQADLAGTAWDFQPGDIQADGSVRTMRVAAGETQQFFRIVPLPLLPPADEDGDGVPDGEDRCPGTYAGARVDRFGCATLDVLGAPEGIFEPERARAMDALRLLTRDGGFERARGQLAAALAPATDPVAPLLERKLGAAVTALTAQVAGLRAALEDFRKNKPGRVAEIMAGAPRLDAEHADVRPQDFEVMWLDDLEALLDQSLAGSEEQLQALVRLNESASGAPKRERVQIRTYDEPRGVAELMDGRRLLLPRPDAPAAPELTRIPVVVGPGSIIEAEFHLSEDGSLLGQGVTPVAPNLDDLVNQIDPRCLRLRIVPAEVGLHLWDSGKRHNPMGYLWGASFASGRYYFEQGMGLAAAKVYCPYEKPGEYAHWLKIMKDADNDGGFGTVANYVDENSLPVVMTPANFPTGTVFPLLVREYRAPRLEGGNLGSAELVAEETLMIFMRPWGDYATANYSRTVFELEDLPSSTEWQSASVSSLTRRYPLTIQPAGDQTFLAGGYAVNGNNTSYPVLQPITTGQAFGVYLKDPNDDAFFAYSEDVGRGLYSPMVRGYRYGHAFQYRAGLPEIVRDRLVNCSGTDTYYRIPFDPVLIVANLFVGGSWNVSQGNNGTFTHNGWQQFAWDFPAPAGTNVRAARGGTVVSVRSTSTQSCWNAAAQACQNCSGSASPNLVSILHQDGTTGFYLHFRVNSVTVSPGQRVYRGSKIAEVGTTGCSTGNHLHFHVVNPAGNQTIAARFEAYDSGRVFRQCYNPPASSSGWSNNEPWNWPF
ncbi:MAG: HYR domain-containing protein [Verrucomicrobiales bacterium]|nr:HYR domain-containing protein [Verrucomicrobiales bacterium]MCP5528356.1 HYR domain-containing protein [Verrucomicrobiales bacterium]